MTHQNKEGLEARLRELIGEYFDLGYAEGVVGRDADTMAGDAQRTLSEIEEIIATFSSLREENERLKKERDEADHALVDRYRDPKTRSFSFPGDVAAIVRALDASQAQLKIYREALEEVSKGIGSVRWMDPPDGGNVSLGEQVRRMRIDLETAERWRDSLREALTPSGDTKAAYSGEFHERIEVANPMHEGNEDDEPETIAQTVIVSWVTIKEVMATILARSSLSQNQEQSK